MSVSTSAIIPIMPVPHLLMSLASAVRCALSRKGLQPLLTSTVYEGNAVLAPCSGRVCQVSFALLCRGDAQLTAGRVLACLPVAATRPVSQTAIRQQRLPLRVAYLPLLTPNGE